MKIMIEIPKEFICDYEADRFEECFQRFIHHTAGNYERETAEMMIKAFRDAKEVINCKDCKYGEYRDDFDDYDCFECHSSGLGLVYDSEFFCADGER